MDFLEMEAQQLKEVVMLPTVEEMESYLESNGITLPEKAPVEWPEETVKFTRMLWQKIKFPPKEYCAEGEHDFQPKGGVEVARNEATLPGSCFRTQFECTKCGQIMWKTEKEPEKKEEAAVEEVDDRAARRAARKAEREAKRAAAAAAEGGEAEAKPEEAPVAEAAAEAPAEEVPAEESAE